MTEEEKRARMNAFHEAVTDEQDPVTLVLRAHLFSEAQMDQIFEKLLPQPQRLFKARLTYAQKLALLHAYDIVDVRIIACLRMFNRVRNELSHDLNKRFSPEDADGLALPVKPFVDQFNDDIKGLPNVKLLVTASFVTGMLEAVIDGLKTGRIPVRLKNHPSE